LFFGSVAFLLVAFYEPPGRILVGPFGAIGVDSSTPEARPAPDAFGRSGGVTMLFSLPGDSVAFPLEVFGDPTALEYQWVRQADHGRVDSLRPLRGIAVRAPSEPGFYRLALTKGAATRVVPEMLLAVKVPFTEKTGSTLNGYRIGTYVSEQRNARSSDRPDGFIEVRSSDVDLPLSRHFRVSDFLTHDNQTVWPRYSAVSAHILDKVELVFARLDDWNGARVLAQYAVDVHSAFRTPLYNRAQSRARESRHQYGDAVDLSIDADGDGRINSRDLRLITAAVDTVEKYYPDLAGGLGVYSGINFRVPYVHIDARGTRVRWRG
jgi:hypothetical protein